MTGRGIPTGTMGFNPGLPDGRDVPEAGAREDAGLPEQRAEPAADAAADGQLTRAWLPDDEVQHMISWTL